MHTRNLDNIVASHSLAAARRREGKPTWDGTIDIKQILQRDPGNTTEAHAAAVANEIGKLVRSKVPASWLDSNADDFDLDLAEIVDGLEALRPDSFLDEPDFSALQDLNEMLAALYDWANLKRIWLGNLQRLER